MTRQTFYIILLIICTAILAVTFIRPTHPPIPDEKCTKHFIMHPVLTDGRRLDVKVVTRGCLLNKHVFKIGQEVTEILNGMPVIITIHAVPQYIADNISKESILIVDKIWIRLSGDQE